MRSANPPPRTPPARRDPEEAKEAEEGEEFAAEGFQSALPAPVGASDSWGEMPPAEAPPAGFGNVEGFEAAGGLRGAWGGARKRLKHAGFRIRMLG